MILQIYFECKIEMVKVRENYMGTLTLGNSKNPKLRFFSFLFLHPYNAVKAEFALYEDENKEVPYCEEVAVPCESEPQPLIGARIIFNFSECDPGKTGWLMAATAILSNSIFDFTEQLERFEFLSQSRPVGCYVDILPLDFTDFPEVGKSLQKELQ